MKISIGIDLHKSQFTTCMLSEDRTVREPGMYPTTELGYREFLKRVAFYEQEGYEVAAAVESTGNRARIAEYPAIFGTNCCKQRLG